MNRSRPKMSGSFFLAVSAATLLALPIARAAELTPDGAMRQSFEAFAANQPDMVFGLLPASYRQDVDTVVQRYATQMDAEVWNRGRALVRRLATVLNNKRDLITPMVANQMGEAADPNALKTAVTGFSTLLEQLSGSPITGLERLRQGNIQGLLADEGRQVMQAIERVALIEPVEAGEAEDHPWAMVRRATVRLVTQDGDRATVAIDGVDQAEDVELVRVEGAWIPAGMADGWKEGVANMLESIDAIDYKSPEGQARKTQVLMMMGMFDGVLGQIEQAKTEAELQASMMGIMMLMGGGAMMAP